MRGRRASRRATTSSPRPRRRAGTPRPRGSTRPVNTPRSPKRAAHECSPRARSSRGRTASRRGRSPRPRAEPPAERPRLPRQRARHGDPGADRREAEARAQPQVAQPREALEVRVDHEHRDGDRPQPAHDRVELQDRDQEHDKRHRHKSQHLRTSERATRQLAHRRTRVPRIDLGVDEPVQGHRERSRSDHGDGDPNHVREAGPGVDREERPDVCEREREHGVLDANKRRQAARERNGGHCGASCHVCRCGVAVSPAASSSPWRERGWDDLEAVTAAVRSIRGG